MTSGRIGLRPPKKDAPPPIIDIVMGKSAIKNPGDNERLPGGIYQ